MGLVVWISGKREMVSTGRLACGRVVIVLVGGFCVDYRRQFGCRGWRLAASGLVDDGRLDGSGGDLVSGADLRCDEHANRASLDRIVDDVQHVGDVFGHGQHSWERAPIAGDDSCHADDSQCSRYLDAGPDDDLLGNVLVGAADGHRRTGESHRHRSIHAPFANDGGDVFVCGRFVPGSLERRHDGVTWRRDAAADGYGGSFGYSRTVPMRP